MVIQASPVLDSTSNIQPEKLSIFLNTRCLHQNIMLSWLDCSTIWNDWLLINFNRILEQTLSISRSDNNRPTTKWCFFKSRSCNHHQPSTKWWCWSCKLSWIKVWNQKELAVFCISNFEYMSFKGCILMEMKQTFWAENCQTHLLNLHLHCYQPESLLILQLNQF